MEPQSNNLNREPNSLEKPSVNPEILKSPDRKLENVPIGALEQIGDNASQERSGTVNDTPQISASDVAIATPSTPVVAQDDASTGLVSTPVVAADDDVIEKEWVNKAKKVITETKGDPYAKEREVSKLQADYMQKRYGKQVKMPDEN